MTAAGIATTSLSWCSRLAAALPGLSAINNAWGGVTAMKGGANPNLDAEQQLTLALAAHADVVVFAFGTNDVRLSEQQSWTAAAIASRLHDLAAIAEQAHVTAFVATVPPNYADIGGDAMVVDVNRALRADAALTGRLIDFDSGFEPAYFVPKNVHVNDAGQELRAARALIALVVAR
jgi:lysophospholipase L1-like esterase